MPAALLLLRDGSLLVADRGSSGLSLYRPDHAEPRWISAPEPLPVLAQSGGDVLAAGLEAVYRIDTDSARAVRVADVPVRAGRIVSLAADEHTLWVGTGGGGSGMGGVYAAAREHPQQWRHRVLEAPVRLEPVGGSRVAAAATRAPHQVQFLDPALRTTGSTGPTHSRKTAQADEARFTQALIALDCSRLLHVVSDLRSDRRSLYVYETKPAPRLVRTRTIEQPLGFVHAAGDRSVVVVSEAGGRREVVSFGWSWKINQEGT